MSRAGRIPSWTPRSALSVWRHGAAVAAVALAGCASVASPVTQPAPYVEPPPPPVNLQGFPPNYRLGFGDGCATARGTQKKDPVRFDDDGNYRTGWQDGLAQCERK